jgi:hypothetical protein
VSFCNTIQGAPALALVDVELSRAQVLRVPAEIAIGKAAGLAFSARHLFVVTSRKDGSARPSIQPPNTSVLFVFDRERLGLLSTYATAGVLDGHTLQVVQDGSQAAGETLLDVVSTGTNQIVRLTLRGAGVVQERVIWSPAEIQTGADTHHLNSLATWRGRRLLSGFGAKSAGTWSSAREGFIEDVDTGERLLTGIHQPHSLLDVDGELAYCQSGTFTVHKMQSGVSQQVPGYPRGLTRVGEHMFVGTSRARRVSKSSGLLTNRSEPGAATGWCTVARLSVETLEMDRVLDLDHMGFEIYDLIAVTETDLWPVISDTEWRDGWIAELVANFEQRDATIAWLHTQVAERDRQIETLHREVAQRDQTVEWLHREVADRDRLVEELRPPPTRNAT